MKKQLHNSFVVLKDKLDITTKPTIVEEIARQYAENFDKEIIKLYDEGYKYMMLSPIEPDKNNFPSRRIVPVYKNQLDENTIEVLKEIGYEVLDISVIPKEIIEQGRRGLIPFIPSEYR